ncbi:MAG: hypothetical protein GY853_02760 [PVC group bacterium]|nr:hypothetical protein [PVC group bacterium]
MKNKNNKAQAMVVVFVYISVISLIAVQITTYASSLRKFVGREILHTKAFYAAEAGLIRKMEEFYFDANIPYVVNAGVGVANFQFPEIELIPATKAGAPFAGVRHDRLQCFVRVEASRPAWITAPFEYQINVRVRDWY